LARDTSDSPRCIGAGKGGCLDNDQVEQLVGRPGLSCCAGAENFLGRVRGGSEEQGPVPRGLEHDLLGDGDRGDDRQLGYAASRRWARRGQSFQKFLNLLGLVAV
jgi:hypothetical protein